MPEMQEIQSALDAIDPAPLEYQTWLNIGFALFELGCPCSVWDDWSRRDSARYQASGSGSCADKWRTMEHGGGVVGSYLFAVARNLGWTWHGTREGEQATRPRKPEPPKPPEISDTQQAAAQFAALFEPSDLVCVVCSAKQDKHGKWQPAEAGTIRTAEEWLNLFENSGSLAAALGEGFNPDAGAWFCINPTNGRGRANEDVTRHRYALVESDEMPIGEQIATLQLLGLPIATLTESGGKSVHAVVRIDADGATHYAERVGRLFKACKAAGFAVDGANKNPSRLTRLAGAKRGERTQRLLSAEPIGAADFPAWERERAAESEQATPNTSTFRPLPTFGTIDIDHLPPLSPELVSGILRRGHSMTLTADSKAGKTWAAIELGLSLASGTPWFGCACQTCKVLYIDFELDPPSFYHRVARVANFRCIDAATVRERFVPWNLRGFAAPLQDLERQFLTRIKSGEFGLIVIDPVYKAMSGDENSAGDVREFVNAVDRVGRESGAAMFYTHHHAKGTTSDRRAIDRGSGSGVFGRYPDALIDLMELVPSEEWTADHESELAGVKSLWRANCTLREFEAQRFDLFFSYDPETRACYHTRDHMGLLSELGEYSSAQIGGRNSGAKAKAKADERNERLAREILPTLWAKADHTQGIPIEQVEEADGRSRKQLKAVIDKLDGWRRVSTANACSVMPLKPT